MGLAGEGRDVFGKRNSGGRELSQEGLNPIPAFPVGNTFSRYHW